MRKKNLLSALYIGVMITLSGTASADTLSIAEKLNTGVNVPHRGMSMEMVENRFGAPNTRNLPVGEPPITRWNYNGFRVYFEYQFVIHSVAN